MLGIRRYFQMRWYQQLSGAWIRAINCYKGQQSKPNKYDPLAEYLEALPSNQSEVILSFSELERILSASLPDSAFGYREWWSNQADYRNRPQAAAWMAAGFRVEEVSQLRSVGRVKFRRAE